MAKGSPKEVEQPNGVVIDFANAFAKRVMARIHEYDDDWPKPNYGDDTVVRFPDRRRA